MNKPSKKQLLAHFECRAEFAGRALFACASDGSATEQQMQGVADLWEVDAWRVDGWYQELCAAHAEAEAEQ